MLLNQTWGPLAYLLPLACGEGKCSVYYEAADKESRKLMLKIPLNSLDGFQQRIQDERYGVTWQGYVIISSTVL